jgi:hypothetical protein
MSGFEIAASAERSARFSPEASPKLADFERGQVSYADFIGITVRRSG